MRLKDIIATTVALGVHLNCHGCSWVDSVAVGL